jgi:DNA-binding CsgD family transcriptional regulator
VRPGLGLTDLELSVLECAVRGLTIPETGRRLGMPESTVKGKRHRIIRKLGVGSVEEIVDDIRDLAHRSARGHSGDPRLSPWAREGLREFDVFLASGMRDEDALVRMHKAFAGLRS